MAIPHFEQSATRTQVTHRTNALILGTDLLTKLRFVHTDEGYNDRDVAEEAKLPV